MGHIDMWIESVWGGQYLPFQVQKASLFTFLLTITVFYRRILAPFAAICIQCWTKSNDILHIHMHVRDLCGVRSTLF